MHCQTAV